MVRQHRRNPSSSHSVIGIPSSRGKQLDFRSIDVGSVVSGSQSVSGGGRPKIWKESSFDSRDDRLVGSERREWSKATLRNQSKTTPQRKIKEFFQEEYQDVKDVIEGTFVLIVIYEYD
jgi:hypothetical protein